MRREADQAVVREPEQHVTATAVPRHNPGALEARVQLRPRHPASSLERLDDRRRAAREDRCVEIELPESRRHARDRQRREPLQHPAQILGRGEVQRPAQRPAAHDRPLGNRLFDAGLGRAGRPQAERPQRALIILRLHGAEPAHRLGGRLEPGARQPLRAKAPLRDVHRSEAPGPQACITSSCRAAAGRRRSARCDTRCDRRPAGSRAGRSGRCRAESPRTDQSSDSRRAAAAPSDRADRRRSILIHAAALLRPKRPSASSRPGHFFSLYFAVRQNSRMSACAIRRCSTSCHSECSDALRQLRRAAARNPLHRPIERRRAPP